MSLKEPDPIRRERFERAYKDWLVSVARDVASDLAAMNPKRRDGMLRSYREMVELRAVFRPLTDPERVKRLAGKEAFRYVLLETETVTFFPSLISADPGALDFAVAMNRRFYSKGLWFSIISLNSEYVRQAPDRVLSFALEHELEMGRRYREASFEMRALSPEEKLQISESARKSSAERLNISIDDLVEEERLMATLSRSQPLIPKPYAEMAMLTYLEDNFDSLEKFGAKSRDEKEAAFGEELYEEFVGWSEFSHQTYRLFVREMARATKDAYSGYV